jgi:hypothetical protein
MGEFGSSSFKGYFDTYQSRVYPQQQQMNNMMVQSRPVTPVQTQGQQGQQQQEGGPFTQAAEIYGYGDKIYDLFNTPAPETPTTAPTAAPATEAGSTSYGAAGWYAAIAALGYNAMGHEWYDPEDIFKGTAMAERWENMDAGKAAGNQVEDIFGEGTGSAMENSSRVISIDPRESWKGITGLAENQRNLMSNAMDDNRDFFKNNNVGKVLSGSGINREMGRGVKNMWSQHEENRSNVTENVKKASNPFKWFD